VTLHRLTATEALAEMRAGAFSAEEYVTELLARAEEHAQLNAFSHLDAGLILRDARASDAMRRSAAEVGPLHGLPVAIKDNINVAGQPTSAGTPALRDHRPDHDAPVVKVLRRAGAILFGRTNMHELAYGLTGDNAAFGAVKNPADPTRIAGGSSSGSAAAVAAALVPVALGTDTGGSVRVPAALCGIIGFRPTQGRYAGEGIVPISHSRDTVGILARNVADTVLLDQVLSGETATLATVDMADLRIGIPRAYFQETLDPETSALVETALQEIASQGATLIAADIDGLEGCNPDIGRPIVSGEVVDDLPAYLAAHTDGITMADVLRQVASPDVKAIIRDQFDPVERGAILAVYRQVEAIARPALRARFARYFDRHRLDAIAIPTTLLPAPEINGSGSVRLAGKPVAIGPALVHNTGPASIVGMPGLTLPAGRTSQGLPVGLELEAKPGRDGHLLAIALTLSDGCDPPEHRGASTSANHLDSGIA
jgi:indoleacetamide hydrolase